MYYGMWNAKAETDALLYLTNPRLEDLLIPWNIYEHPFFNKILDVMLPSLGCNKVIYIPRLFPRITRDVILQEYEGQHN